MISLENIHFSFKNSSFQLKIKELKINPLELVAITGSSGSGKSTLLNFISGELLPQSGSITVLDKSLSKMDENERRKFRLQNIGLFKQSNNLLDYLNVKENILLLKKLNRNFTLDNNWEKIAAETDIKKLLNRYPEEISEGEKQRVVLCRVLSGKSPLILADEPTSHLDPENSLKITTILTDHCRKEKKTLLMVTHDHSILPFFDRIIDMKNFGGNE